MWSNFTSVRHSLLFLSFSLWLFLAVLCIFDQDHASQVSFYLAISIEENGESEKEAQEKGTDKVKDLQRPLQVCESSVTMEKSGELSTLRKYHEAHLRKTYTDSQR